MALLNMLEYTEKMNISALTAFNPLMCGLAASTEVLPNSNLMSPVHELRQDMNPTGRLRPYTSNSRDCLLCALNGQIGCRTTVSQLPNFGNFRRLIETQYIGAEKSNQPPQKISAK